MKILHVGAPGASNFKKDGEISRGELWFNGVANTGLRQSEKIQGAEIR